MQYLALYRKFRPKKLSEVIGQEHIVKTLSSQIESGRISHAYLFCGPRGTGKTSIAKIFAAAINCQNDKTGNPCGVCASCVALNDLSNFDVTEIDAASNNRVDEIRELREKVKFLPVSVKYKVYIIDEVHMLTDQAFNALLKTLEEPPQNTVFILATTEVHKLLPTILSRCMRFDFKLIPQSQIAKHIQEVFKKSGKEFEIEAIDEIARAGAGSVRDALSIAEVCLSYGDGKLTYSDVIEVLGGADFDSLYQMGKAIILSDFSTALKSIDTLIKNGKSAAVLARDITNFLRNTLICLTCKDSQNILSLPPEYFDRLDKVSKNANINGLVRGMEILAKAESQMRYATSPKTVLETAVVKICQPEIDYNLDAIISRIKGLEKLVSDGKIVNKKHLNSIDIEKNKDDNLVENKDNTNLSGEITFDNTQLDDIGTEEFTFEKTQLNDIEAEEIASKKTQLDEIAVAQAEAVNQNDFDKDKLWGQFNILLRKSGEFILRTVVSELDVKFEGEKLIILADTAQKHSVLTAPENIQKIKGYLLQLGCSNFEVADACKKCDEDVEIKKIQKNFPNIKITVEQEE